MTRLSILVGALTCLLASTVSSTTYSQFYVDPETGDFILTGSAIHDSGEVNFPQLLVEDIGRLELVADQQAEIERQLRLVGIANMDANNRRRSGETDAKEFAKSIERNRMIIRDVVHSTLLPMQVNELKRIAFEKVTADVPLSKVFSKESVCNFLGLTDEEKQILEKKAKEINDQLERDIAALRQKAQSELLSELPAEKRAALGPIFNN